MTSYRDVNYDWTFENALGLAEEVLGVVHQATDRELGIVNCLPIKSNEEDIGCSLSFMTDTIFIQCGGVRHPFDIVSTVLHEIGHQMVYRTEHECPDKHCVTWSRCCMTIAAVFEQSEKLTPLLRLIEEEYGAEWAKQLVQSDTACTRCPMTAKQRRQQNRLRALTNESKSEVLYTTAQLDAKLDEWNKTVLEEKIDADEVIEVEDDEAEEDVIIISDDEEGWQMQLEEDDEMESELWRW